MPQAGHYYSNENEWTQVKSLEKTFIGSCEISYFHLKVIQVGLPNAIIISGNNFWFNF
uniref:Uncharacterized protein n=1 Tax=Daphnia magna TaxID=35525 RepID=A0A0P5UJW2_9CRUS